eukprot:763348-Hanusia_phi.AAC.1
MSATVRVACSSLKDDFELTARVESLANAALQCRTAAVQCGARDLSELGYRRLSIIMSLA